MRDFRFLVPPTMMYITWFLMCIFHGQQLLFASQNLSYFASLGLVISLPAIGFIISQVLIFLINIYERIIMAYCYSKFKDLGFVRAGTFYFMDPRDKFGICARLYSCGKCSSLTEINACLWFAEYLAIGKDELHKWLERRWSVIMTNLNSLVSLILTIIIILYYYKINSFVSGDWFFIIGGVILLFNSWTAWKDVRVVENRFFEYLRTNN